jgi:hypothetical protein
MKRFGALCVLAVLAAGCEARSPLAPGASGAPPTGAVTFQLSGTVVRGAGIPVEGALVQAIGQFPCEETSYPDPGHLPPCVNDQVLGVASTDVQGQFTISQLPAIFMRVDVQQNGIVVSSQGVNLQQDSTLSFVVP